MNERLQIASIKHHAKTISNADKINLKFLKELEVDLQNGVTSNLDAIKTRGRSALPLKRIQYLLLWVRDRITQAGIDFKNELKPILLTSAREEAAWQLDTLSQAVPAEIGITFSAVSPALINRLPLTAPMGGQLMTEYAQQWTNATRLRVVSEVRLGVAQGETTASVVSRLSPVLRTSQAGARAIVHTTIAGVVTSARDLVFEENADIIKGVQWVSTLDSRTTPFCQEHDGKVYPLHSGPRPPAHWNSLVGDTLITTISGPMKLSDIQTGNLVLTHRGRFKRVLAVMQKDRPDDFRIHRIKLDSGRELLASKEHPLLTCAHEWVRAGEVKVGAQVFENDKNRFNTLIFSFFNSKKVPYDCPSCFDHSEVFDTLTFESASIPMAVSVNFEDYHSIGESKVSDPIVKNHLMHKFTRTTFIENVKKWFLRAYNVRSVMFSLRNHHSLLSMFISRWVINLHSLTMFFVHLKCFFSFTIPVMLLSENSFPSFSMQRRSFSLTSNIYSESMRYIPNFFIRSPYTRFPELRDDGWMVNSKVAVYRTKTLAINYMSRVKKFYKLLFGHRHWLTPTVIEVESVPYQGPMYNLSVDEDETYVANGMIVSNCRSTTVPILKSWRELGINLDEIPAATRPVVRDGLAGDVPASKTYAEVFGKKKTA